MSSFKIVNNKLFGRALNSRQKVQNYRDHFARNSLASRDFLTFFFLVLLRVIKQRQYFTPIITESELSSIQAVEGSHCLLLGTTQDQLLLWWVVDIVSIMIITTANKIIVLITGRWWFSYKALWGAVRGMRYLYITSHFSTGSWRKTISPWLNFSRTIPLCPYVLSTSTMVRLSLSSFFKKANCTAQTLGKVVVILMTLGQF